MEAMLSLRERRFDSCKFALRTLSAIDHVRFAIIVRKFLLVSRLILHVDDCQREPV